MLKLTLRAHRYVRTDAQTLITEKLSPLRVNVKGKILCKPQSAIPRYHLLITSTAKEIMGAFPQSDC